MQPARSPHPSSAPARSRLGRTRHAALGATALALACTSTTPTENATLLRTAILVAPEDFLGDHLCADLEGAVRGYQATLVDVSEDLEEPFSLASTDLLACNTTAFFGYVTPGRRYTALIEAYDQADLHEQSKGVRVVLDAEGAPVRPRYRSYCRGEDDANYGGAGGGTGEGGQSALGAEALLNARIYVRGCGPLVDSGTLGPTGVSISVESALLGLSCGSGPGQIERFVVDTGDAPDPGLGGAGNGGAGGAGGAGSGGPSGPGATCTGSVVIDGLLPAINVSYPVALFEAGASTPSYETTCRAFTVAGVIVEASCAPVEPRTP